MIDFPKPDVEQFFQTYGIRTFGISADESRLVFSSSLNGKFNLWAMELEGRHPTLIRLHTMTRSQASLSWTRKGGIS